MTLDERLNKLAESYRFCTTVDERVSNIKERIFIMETKIGRKKETVTKKVVQQKQENSPELNALKLKLMSR